MQSSCVANDVGLLLVIVGHRCQDGSRYWLSLGLIRVRWHQATQNCSFWTLLCRSMAYTFLSPYGMRRRVVYRFFCWSCCLSVTLNSCFFVTLFSYMVWPSVMNLARWQALVCSRSWVILVNFSPVLLSLQGFRYFSGGVLWWIELTIPYNNTLIQCWALANGEIRCGDMHLSFHWFTGVEFVW